MIHKNKDKTGAVIFYPKGIPYLEEIFDLIDEGKLDLEEDEVISYYYDEWDQKYNKICVGSFHQIMKLYELKDEVFGK